MRLFHPPAHSYYADSAGTARLAPRAPLAGEQRADVAVIGGGVAGCSAALHLAERGYRVALLEAQHIGYGASGRSGVQTIFGLAASQAALAAQVGPADARRLFELSVAALDLTQTLIAAHRIECDYRPNHLHVAVLPRHLREIAAWERELHELYGYTSARALSSEELRTHVSSGRYLGALLDARSGHLHPLKYTLGLARAAEAAGARIFEGSAALGYREGTEVLVSTAGGTLRCRHLVLAGNAYLGSLAPVLARRILGVGTYMVATEPLDPGLARALLPSGAAVADLNWILDYFRLSADHRLLFGGRVSYSALEPRHLAETMRRRMLRVFPQLHAARVTHCWGGLLDITMSRAPDFGRLAPNVLYLQGFSGHGMALAGLAGQLAAEAVAGTAERFDVFARIPHRDFPGGRWLRRPTLMLAMLYFRLRDVLG